MNDPIRDCIAKNRAEFDHLEAPAFDIKKFRERVPVPTSRKNQVLRLLPAAKWICAASIFVAGATFLYSTKTSERMAIKAVAHDYTTLASAKAKAKGPVEQPANAFVQRNKKPMWNASSSRSKKAVKVIVVDKGAEKLFEQLADSSSSSTRLAAILEIKRQGTLSNYVIDRLAAVLNNDNNSNVRLAALGILRSYGTDEYVSSLLVSSLGTQIDPMVQLELVSLLGTMNHLKIEDKLFALAADPNTFGAVKDEAYSILLNQNKL
ncbi:MAG: hypothetical protein WKF66_12560 [Pedobacter sp.]